MGQARRFAYGFLWDYSISRVKYIFLCFLDSLEYRTEKIPGMEPIDPFPFGLLTMVVSLEAIFLAIIVLISQNREARVAELREEVELYINTYAENEITKVMYLLTLLIEKSGIDVSKDEDLKDMLISIDSDAVENELEKQLSTI